MEKEKLNIGLFIDTFFPMLDGVINVVDNYAKRLSQVANVTVFAPKPRKDFNDNSLPYKVVRCNRLKLIGFDYDLPLPKLDKQFKEEMKNAKLDLIHIHSPFTVGKIGASFGKKNNIPVVATMHSQFKQDFKKATKSEFISKMLLKNIAKTFNLSDVLWTMNPACVKLSKEYGYTGKTDIVPNGTDLKNEFSKEEIETFKQEVRKKYKIADDEKIFMNIGRLNKLKNIDFVINVCKVLKDLNFKFKLLLIGSGKDEEHFKNKVKSLKLQKNIIFVGKVYKTKEKCKLFASADLQVFPSFYDTDGIVRIEAAAFNTPTIFIKDSIAASAITDNVNGFIGENDTTKFAEKIIEIFKNEELYKKVKTKCFEDLYKDWDNIVEIVLKKYYNIINKGEKNG